MWWSGMDIQSFISHQAKIRNWERVENLEALFTGAAVLHLVHFHNWVWIMTYAVPVFDNTAFFPRAASK